MWSSAQPGLMLAAAYDVLSRVSKASSSRQSRHGHVLVPVLVCGRSDVQTASTAAQTLAPSPESPYRDDSAQHLLRAVLADIFAAG